MTEHPCFNCKYHRTGYDLQEHHCSVNARMVCVWNETAALILTPDISRFIQNMGCGKRVVRVE